MPVLSMVDTKTGQSISWSGQSGRVYTNTLIVITDTPALGPRALLQALGFRNGDYYRFPLSGTPAEWDYGSFIQSLSAKKTAEDGCQWEVEIQYGPFDWTNQGGATTEAAADGRFDPFAIPPQVSWGSAKYERSIDRDALGNIITNSAGDPFDPPLKRDDSRPTLTVVRNEASFDPLYVQHYKDTVNGTVFLGFDINTVKCDDVTAKREHHADYGYYWEVTYTFSVRPIRLDPANQNLIDNGWMEQVLNAGLRSLDDDGKARPVILGGAPVSSPVCLNHSGVYPGAGYSGYYLEIQVYPQMDFTAFNFPDNLLTVKSVAGPGGS